AVENKDYLYKYQQDFFSSAISNAEKSRIRAYRFGATNDQNRVKAFIDKLLIHKIEVYKAENGEYLVPTRQAQYRMVQTMFETYDKYRDSVYYDASAWSVANFYHMKYRPVNSFSKGERVNNTENLVKISPVTKSEYAYLIDWDDYNAPAVLNELQTKGLVLSSAFKPFTAQVNGASKRFNYGTLLVPVSLQKKSADEVFDILKTTQDKFMVPMFGVETGYNLQGVDLGSSYMRPLEKPKAAMLIGTGVRSYEAGEVWHLLDTRVGMPITKIPLRNFNRVKFDQYNTLVMVSGNYSLTEKQQNVIKDWVKKGNTLITIGTGSEWIIKKKWVKEKLIKSEVDSTKAPERKAYVNARENLGKESVGGIIIKAHLDVSHPLGFGYREKEIPVYKNNTVWLTPSQNEYATVAKYTDNPHIDGFITSRNLEKFLKPAASLVVSPLGSGRVVLFADNPNFRGSWYGTNRLFLNALFLGQKITVPKRN
ncbi:MAG: zinc carboxypeptidase, partial [Eudoraea sp.]|nr:zinc carboxypeptidase [Eudoraea sp.]